jgi:hypothetical protein
MYSSEDDEFVTSGDVFDEATEQRMDQDDLAKQRARMGLPIVEHPLDPRLPLSAAGQFFTTLR